MYRYLSSKNTFTEIINLGEQYLSPAFNSFQIYNEPFAVVGGNMQYLYGGLRDQQSRAFIDLMSHNLTLSLGYGHPEVSRAVMEENARLPTCTAMFRHPQLVRFAKEIIGTLPPHPSGDPWVLHPTNSGAEAVDLVYQITSLNVSQEARLLTLNNSFHGLQGLALHATAIGNVMHKSPYMRYIDHIDPDVMEFDRYRHLQKSIHSSIGCFLAESIRGFGGVISHPPGFLKYAFDHVNKMGGLTFVDEIQTLFRTGRMWAFEDQDVIPDGIVFGKGIANGMPISGLICRRSLTEPFAKKKFFNTFAGNPVACAAARATMRVIENDNLIDHSSKMGAIFKEGFLHLCKTYPMLYKESRGSNGLYQGLVINGKTPDHAKKHAHELQCHLRDDYDIVIGKGGVNADVFRIQPPLSIQDYDVHWVLDSLEEAGRVYLNKKGL